MNWKDILKYILKHGDMKLLAKTAGNPLFRNWVKEQLEKFLRKELKKYDADITIKKLKLKPSSTTVRIHMEADGELDCEEMPKVLKKIGL